MLSLSEFVGALKSSMQMLMLPEICTIVCFGGGEDTHNRPRPRGLFVGFDPGRDGWVGGWVEGAQPKWPGASQAYE